MMKRICSILLLLALLLALTQTVWADGAPSEPEVPADAGSATLMSDPDINALPALPYDTWTTVTKTDQENSAYIKFTPPADGAYTVYTSDQKTYVRIYRWTDAGLASVASGKYSPDMGELRCIPLKAGKTYVLSPWLSTGESIDLRIVSFADELKKAQNLPLLTGLEEEGLQVSYTGEEDCVAARFTPAVTGSYTISLDDRNVYKVICGKENVYGYEYDYSYMNAELIAGEEYLIYVRIKSGTDGTGTLRVTLNPIDVTTYPLARTPAQIAAELAAGPVRYTVLILDDDSETSGLEGNAVVEDQKKAAMELCQALSAAPGTNYIAVVSMGWYRLTLSNVTAEVLTNPMLFTSDLDILQEAINWVDGNSQKGCDISMALEIAQKLLDPVQEAYGPAVQTNIVLFTDGGNSFAEYMSQQEKGPYMEDTYSSWASPHWCNACYTKARFVGAKYPIYVANINAVHGYGYVSAFEPISPEEQAFLNRFLKDLSTGEGRYFEIYSTTIKNNVTSCTLKQGIGTQIADTILRRSGSVPSDQWMISLKLTGTELQYQASSAVPAGAKLVVAAYADNGKLLRCLVVNAAGYDKVTVPDAAKYKAFLVSSTFLPLIGALSDFG